MKVLQLIAYVSPDASEPFVTAQQNDRKQFLRRTLAITKRVTAQGSAPNFGLKHNMPFADAVFPIASYVAAINFTAFMAFAWDKFCARNDMWRVPETILLTLAALGGTVGAMIGQRILRHKTAKQPFETYLRAITVIQIVGLGALLFQPVRSSLWHLLGQIAG